MLKSDIILNKNIWILLLKMSFKQILKKYEEGIQGKNQNDTISKFEEISSENVEEISKNDSFFNLPLKNIFSSISKVEFNKIEENAKIIQIIQNIVKNLIKKHSEEKETILILQNLNITTISF